MNFSVNVSGVQRTSAAAIKKNNFHPYKRKVLHELNEEDYDRHLQICETTSEREYMMTIFFLMCFSDEFPFFFNDTVNHHNCFYWNANNSKIFHEVYTHYPPKLNVWIFGGRIIGPEFSP